MLSLYFNTDRSVAKLLSKINFNPFRDVLPLATCITFVPHAPPPPGVPNYFLGVQSDRHSSLTSGCAERHRWV